MFNPSSGADISVGTLISNGTSGNSLAFALTNGVNPAFVEVLIENIRYQNSSNNPTQNRVFTTTLEDGEGEVFTQNTTVTVFPQNDAPAGTDATVTILEPSLAPGVATRGFAASDFGFTDADTGAALQAVRIDTLPMNGTLTLGGVAVTAGQVILSADLANLLFTATDNAANTVASFTFSVQDNNSAFDASPNTFTINVTGLNDAPLGADNMVSITEPTPGAATLGFAASDFGFTDIDTDQAALSAVRVDTLPMNGTLTLSGVAVTAGQVILAADLANLLFTATDTSADTVASFTFSVRDAGGAFDLSPNTFTINTDAVNDAPAGTDATVTILEPSLAPGVATRGFAASDFGFTDADTDGAVLQAVRIDTLPMNGTLTLGGVAVTAGQVILSADLANLLFTATDNAANTVASFTFSVQDNNSAFDASPNTFTINVTGLNDAPLGADNMVSITEPTPGAATLGFAASDFGFTDIDTDQAALSAVRVDTLPMNGTLTLSGVAVTAGQVILAADLANLLFTATDTSADTVASFTFSVRDAGGAFDLSPNTFTINTDAVNDAPAGTDATVTILEPSLAPGVATRGFAASDFGFTDADTDGAVLQAVRIDTLPMNGTLTLGGVAVTAGQVILSADLANLLFTATDNAANTVASFTFSVQDNNSAFDASPNTFTINVTGLNDAPLGADNMVSITEPTPGAATLGFAASDFGFTDIDTDQAALSAVRVDTLPMNGTLTLSGVAVTAGQVILAADLANLLFTATDTSADTVASFTFSVRDAGGAFDLSPNTFTINTDAVNDAPAGTDATVTILEPSLAPGVATRGFAASDFGFTDADTGAALQAVRIDTLPMNGTLTLGGVAVTAGQVILSADLANLLFTATDNAANTVASFTFSVQDNNSAFDASPNTFTINVTGLNDAPLGADNMVSITEPTPGAATLGFAASDFGFTDIDTDQAALSAVRVDTLPMNGTLTLSGVAVTAGQVILAADLANLLFTATDTSADTVASFTFSVRDAGGAFDLSPNTFTINTDAVNDAPAGTDATVTILEPSLAPGVATRGFAASDFGFTDADTDGAVLQAVRIDTLPMNGTLTLGGVAVTAGQVILSADLANLLFTATDNAANTVASFTFSVQDNNSAFDASPNTFTINVTGLNDAPLGADNMVSITEPTPGAATLGFAASDFGFTDIDTDQAALSAVRVDTLPMNGTLTLSGVAVTAGQVILAADLANLLFTATDTSADTVASFTFSVRDAGGAFDLSPNTFTINTDAVNDAPAGTDATVTILEPSLAPGVATRGFAASDFGFTDADTDGAVLQAVRIDTLPMNGTLTLGGVAVTAGQVILSADLANLLFTATDNAANTVASFTFSVQDNNSAFDASPNTFTINVTGLNDAPLGADNMVSITEPTPGAATLGFAASDFGFTDIDTDQAALSAVRVDTLPMNGTLTLSGVAVTAGQVILAADLANLLFTATDTSADTVASFTFSVRDAGGAFDLSPNTFTINTDAVNDAPAGTDATVTILEPSLAPGVATRGFAASDFGFTDADTDGAVLQAVRIDTLPMNGTLTLGGVAVTAGQVILSADLANLLFTATDNAANTVASFTFSVQDNNSAFDASPNTFTINVTGLNDAPLGADNMVSITEPTPGAATLGFAASDFGFTDIDTDQAALSAVRVDTLPMNGTLTLSGVAVTAGQVILAADLANLLFTATDTSADTVASFTFSVRDAGGAFDLSPNTFTINTDAVNDAPAGTDATVTILEPSLAPGVATRGFAASDFGFTDADTDGAVLQAVRIDTLPMNGTLTLGGVAVTAGQVILSADLANLLFTATDNAANTVASFTFSVQDNNSAFDASPNTFTINVTGLNDAPVLSTIASATRTDTATDDTFVNVTGTVSATDADASSVLTYGLSGVTSASSVIGYTLQQVSVYGTIHINITSGAYLYIPNDTAVEGLRSGATPSETFTFTVSDGQGGSDTETFTVNLVGANDTIAAVADTGTLSEDGPALLGNLTTNDLDRDLPLQVAVSGIKAGTAAGAFTPVGSTGATVLSTFGTLVIQTDGSYVFTPNDNAQTINVGDSVTQTFTYQVADASETAVTQTLTLTINGANDAPLIGAVGTQSFTENGSAIAVAPTLTVTDVDDAFINGATVSLTNAMASDALSIDGIAGPSGNLAGGISFTITNGTSISFTGLASKADYQAALRKVQFLNNSQQPDTAQRTITFTVLDDANLSSVITTALVTVVSVNDAPVASILPTSFAATEQVALAVTGLSISDVDAGSAAVTVTLSVGQGSLTVVAGAGVTVGTNGTSTVTLTGTVAEINALLAGLNSVTYLNGSDAPSPSTVLTLSVNDSGNTGTGGALTGADTATITIAAVNDAPVNTIPGPLTVAEDVTQAILGVSVVDVDGVDILTTTVSVTNGILTVTSGAGVSDNGTSEVTIVGTAAQINAALAGLRYTGNLNFNGSDTLTVLTSDNVSGLDIDTVALTITAVNDAPVAVVVTLPAATEDTVYTFTAAQLLAGVTDVDGPAATITAVSIATGGGTLTSDGNGNYTYTPALNDDTAVTFAYTASDGTLSSSSTASLDITAVNDAPVAVVVTLPAATEDTVYTFTAAQLLAGVTDVDGPAATITAVSIATGGGTLTSDGNGNYTYTPALNDDTAVTFAYTASDGTLSSSSTASLDITAVNDAPVATGLTQTLMVAEDAAATRLFTTAPTLTDGDSTSVTATLSLSNVAAGTLTGGSFVTSGGGVYTVRGTPAEVAAALVSVQFLPSSNFNGAVSVTVSVTDGGSNGPQGTNPLGNVSVTITPVNDAPVINSNGGGATATINVQENSTFVTATTATDVDSPTSSLVYSLVGGADASRFVINGTTGALTFTTAPNFEAPSDAGLNNTYEVVVQVSDGLVIDQQALQIVVTDQLFYNGTAGADNIIGDSSNETLDGGDGNDVLNGVGGIDALFGRAGNDTLIGGTEGDYLYGGGDNDLLYGEAGVDALFGETGNDTLVGGDGGDYLYGGAGVDRLYGEAGSDAIFGGEGDDFLYGQDGIDYLYGDSGADQLIGGAGNDALLGGAGNDTLVGGLGSDLFYVNGNFGFDTVVDFSRAEGDRIIFSAAEVNPQGGVGLQYYADVNITVFSVANLGQVYVSGVADFSDIILS